MEPQIDTNAGSGGNAGLAIFIQRYRAVLIQDFTNETWIVGNSAIGDSGVGHRHLQRRGQHITLANRNVGGVGLRPAFPWIMNRHPLWPGHDSGLLAREMNAALLAQTDPIASTSPLLGSTTTAAPRATERIASSAIAWMRASMVK